MNIYLANETTFTRNGLGFLNECISANVTESLNGDYVLNIKYPLNANMSEYLVEGNIIKSNVGNDNYQLFRIDRVTKDFNTIDVYALHISYDLLNNMLVDVYPQNLTCEAYGNWLLNNTQYSTNFTFQSDISSSASGRYVRKNPIDAIMGNDDNSMINLFGGELERNNYVIKLLQSRGANNGVKLIFGKNITQIKTIVDITSLYTRIMPVGYDGLLLPEKFVDSTLINNYPTPRIAKVEFSNIKYDPTGETEGAYTNLQDAYTALRNAVYELYAQGVDKPTITIKVDWLELSKTEQYKTMYSSLERVNLGDTITAQILGFDYTTKVTKTTYNVLTDTIDKFEIGTIQKSITNTINTNMNALEQVNPSSILSQAKTDATNLINNALGGYIYLDYDTGNLYIMDTDDPSTAQKVWRWNLNGLGYSSTGINGTYGIAMTMNGEIVADFITTGTLNTNVINGYNSLTTQVYDNTQAIGDRSLKTSTITQEIDAIEAQIGDIADITTSASATDAEIEETELQNIANSYPIRIEIHPIEENISYLYPIYTGRQLYNFQDTTTVTSGIIVDDDGWISVTYDNSSGTSTKNFYYYTNNLPLKTSTQYAVFLEIKSVSGTGSITAYSSNATAQFSSGTNPRFTTLNSGDIKKYTPTTKSSFDGVYNGLRNVISFTAGQSGSITFRISVIEDTSVSVNDFEYEPYIDTGLYPSNTLYPKVRNLKFTNMRTNDTFNYTLPQDLLFYDSSNYDEFIADYEANTCQIIKRCEYNADGSVSVLATPVTTSYSFADEIESHFALTEGNYKVQLLGYTSGFLFIRLMVLNAYTAQYATKVELQSSMQQTATAITAQVSRDYETKENAYSNYSQWQQTADELSTEVSSKVGDNEIISKINQTAEQIKIQASKVNLQGYVTATDLSGTGTTTINGSNITTGTISANRVSGGTLQGTTLQGNNISGGTINLSSQGENPRYTITDNENGNCYYTQSARSIKWYGLNGGNITMFNTLSTPIIGLSGMGSTTTLRSYNIETPQVIQTSLESEKKNFEKLDNALDIIKDVDIYKYNLKHQKDKDKKHIGFVIGDKYNYSHEITAVNEEGKEVGADLYSMTSVCLQAIKEQQIIIENLQKRIEVLENDN